MRGKNLIDETDKEIIKILVANARAPYIEISTKVGLSVPAVAARVNRLINEKIIDPTCNINYYKLGRQVSDIAFNLKAGIPPGTRERLAEELIKHPQVESVWLCTGFHHMVVVIEERDVYSLERLADEIIMSRPEVDYTHPLIRTKEIMIHKKKPFSQRIEDVYPLDL
ncbi:MAG: Lrp/AsnC family transcriptional regulator [Candidatus Methanomethyliaceae archaeon]